MRTQRFKGQILVLFAFALIVLAGITAFVVDIGYICTVQSELQNSADAAALAGANRVLDDVQQYLIEHPEALAENGGTLVLPDGFYDPARVEAREYAAYNLRLPLELDLNSSNDPAGDLVIGQFVSADDPLDVSNPAEYDSVLVNAHTSFSLYLAKLFGLQHLRLTATAQATFQPQIVGFQSPGEGEPSSLLPIAIHVNVWNALVELWQAGVTDDSFAYDPETGLILPGSDGIPEINLYPGAGAVDDEPITQMLGHLQVTPGNFGTVSIGGDTTSASILDRQILVGPTAEDFEFHGGELSVENGPIHLHGSPGLAASLTAALNLIQGQTRTVLVFDTASGTGAGTDYRIVGFGGVRVLDARLSGHAKGLWVQPATVQDPGGIGGETTYDYLVAGAPVLTR